MKLILSRKGFDGTCGGCASPIFRNRRLYSLPIPMNDSSTQCYEDLRVDAGIPQSEIAKVVADLTRGNCQGNTLTHVDPDLDATAQVRAVGWRSTFGQAGAAQSHLAANGVGPGDLFLFFGWFAEVELGPTGVWRRVRGTRDLHVLFGWLQVGTVIDIADRGRRSVLQQYPWLSQHPHLNVMDEGSWGKNVAYIAADQLAISGRVVDNVKGAGAFEYLDSHRILTSATATKRSEWCLPLWFKQENADPELTYHTSASRWTRNANGWDLRTVGRGQEFVIDCAGVSGAADWILGLFRAS